MPDSIDDLTERLRAFAAARDWQRFHAPKNLAIALSVEASELLEHFQWMGESDSRHLTPERHEAVSQELADVFLYLLMLADALGVDPAEVARRKIELNEHRYPVDKARGTSAKYTEL